MGGDQIVKNKDATLKRSGGGSGRGRYYRLSRAVYDLLLGALEYHVDRRLSAENAKARVLGALGDRTLTNAQVREITQMGRKQALWLMKSLEKEGLIDLVGKRRGSQWQLTRKTT